MQEAIRWKKRGGKGEAVEEGNRLEEKKLEEKKLEEGKRLKDRRWRRERG